MPNLASTSTSNLPYYFGVGDHRCFITDFPKSLFFGKDLILIARSNIRRLTLVQLWLVQNYLEKAEQLLDHHRVGMKIDDLKDEWPDLTQIE